MRQEDNQQVTGNDLDWAAGILDGDGCVYVGILHRKNNRRHISPSVCLDNKDPDILNHYVWVLRGLGINPHLRASRPSSDPTIKVDVTKQAHLLKLVPHIAYRCIGYKARRLSVLTALLNDPSNIVLAEHIRELKLVDQPRKPSQLEDCPVPGDDWFAGLFDAEGNVFLKQYDWGVCKSICIANQDMALVEASIGYMRSIGCRHIGIRKASNTPPGCIPVWLMTLQNKVDIITFCERVMPHSRSNKRFQMQVMYNFLLQRRGRYTEQDRLFVNSFPGTPTTLRETPFFIEGRRSSLICAETRS